MDQRLTGDPAVNRVFCFPDRESDDRDDDEDKQANEKFIPDHNLFVLCTEFASG